MPLTEQEIEDLKLQGFHFRATAAGVERFTPEEEAEWAATLATAASIPPPRRLIKKSVVQERVNDIGKLGTVLAALNAEPLYFARWFAPDWPNVYADDEGLLAVLTAVGCTEGEIAAITAP